jgi:hypothetical protein
MIKKEGLLPSFFIRFSADTNFFITAAYNELYVGCQDITIGIGKGLYGLFIDINFYRKDIAIGIVDNSFFDIGLFPSPVSLQLNLLSYIGFYNFSNFG